MAGPEFRGRIGDSCWFFHGKEWKRGILRFWSMDHVNYEQGVGHFPVGVIEDSRVFNIVSVNVNLISFRRSDDRPNWTPK